MENFPVLASMLSSPSPAGKKVSFSDNLTGNRIEDQSDKTAKRKNSRFTVTPVTPEDTRIQSEYSVFDKNRGRKISPGFEHDGFRPAFARRLEDEYKNMRIGERDELRAGERSSLRSGERASARMGERADILSSIHDEYSVKGWGRGAGTGWEESTGYGFVQDNFLLDNTGADKVNNFGNWIQEDFSCPKGGIAGSIANTAWDQDEFQPLRRVDRATDFVNWKLDEYRPLSRREGYISHKENDVDCRGEEVDFLRKMSDDFKHFRQMKKKRPSRTSTGSTSSESSGRRRHSAGNLSIDQDFV